MASHNTGIYEIRNVVNGKKYVGSSVDFRARWGKHQRELNRGAHHSRHLQQSWDKHGPECFIFRVILTCSRDELLTYEQLAFKAFSPEFNILPNAGSCLGVKRTKEFSEAVGKRKTGQTHSAKTKKQISDRLKELGIYPRLTEEVRARMSASKKGKLTPQLQKLRDMKIGVARTADVRAKLSKAMAKLSVDQVRSIRKRYENGERQKLLGEEFGVRQSCISEIVRGVSYAWVQ